VGDVITCLIDFENGNISYMKNGISLGVAFELRASSKSSVMFPAILLKDSSVIVNFGQSPFRYPPPLSYQTLHHASPDDIICGDASYLSSNASNSGRKRPLALIIEPARDLAEQVYQNLEKYSQYITQPSITSLLIVGGETNSKALDVCTLCVALSIPHSNSFFLIILHISFI
jgi:ATP-dependent RNA helicase DDX1